MTLIRTKKTALAILTAASVLFAPASAIAASYTIVSGDTLSAIAAAHNTSPKALQGANPTIEDQNKIYAGAAIVIPDATPAVATVPSPEPASAPEPALTGCELARSLINQYSWDHETAYQVMVAESSCDPNAVNSIDNHGSCVGSYGLFQMNCTLGQLYDPAANVAAAYAMWQQSGWSGWGATTCAVKVVCN